MSEFLKDLDINTLLGFGDSKQNPGGQLTPFQQAMATAQQPTSNLDSFSSSLAGYGNGGGAAIPGGGGGIFGSLGDIFSAENLSMGADLVGMGGGILGMYNAMQDRNMMEDMMKYGKKSANRNMANEATLTNDRLADRERSKNAWNAGTGRAPVSYGRVDGSPIK